MCEAKCIVRHILSCHAQEQLHLSAFMNRAVVQSVDRTMQELLLQYGLNSPAQSMTVFYVCAAYFQICIHFVSVPESRLSEWGFLHCFSVNFLPVTNCNQFLHITLCSPILIILSLYETATSYDLILPVII